VQVLSSNPSTAKRKKGITKAPNGGGRTGEPALRSQTKQLQKTGRGHVCRTLEPTVRKVRGTKGEKGMFCPGY
jgi:hypothetical protein